MSCKKHAIHFNREQFVFYICWPFEPLDFPALSRAEGYLALCPWVAEVLFDLVHEIDPTLMNGWNGMVVHDTMPKVK